ncbi:hypothetical protein H9624_15385, partial [Actinomycetaceae bacterium Sa1BUA1]|nr:hypothetical protein [Oceanitalea stevensii]
MVSQTAGTAAADDDDRSPLIARATFAEALSPDFAGLVFRSVSRPGQTADPTPSNPTPGPGQARPRPPAAADEEPPGWPGSLLAELLPQPGALGDYLEPLAPNERLATLLAAIDPVDVDDFSLVELVAAHKRMEAWSAAQAARAAAVLAERDSVNPTWPGDVPGRTRGECVVGQELSMRLRITKQAAVRMAACGRAFGGMFEPTGELLDRGLIDWPR